MSIKSYRLFAFVVVIALLLAACAPAATPTAVPTQPTAAPAQPTAAPAQPTAAPAQPTAAPTAAAQERVLKVWHYESANGAMGKAWAEAMKEFEATHPGVKVQFEEKGFEQIRQTASMILLLFARC